MNTVARVVIGVAPRAQFLSCRERMIKSQTLLPEINIAFLAGLLYLTFSRCALVAA